MRYRRIPYDIVAYDFVTPVARLMETNDLSSLHEDHHELFKISADSSTSFHRRFYDRYHNGWSEFVELYEGFIRGVVAPLHKGNFLYQKFPTFRIHLRNNLAVGAFHNDASFGHPVGEVNYIIPLTNSDDEASVWLESQPGKGDFVPIALRVGQLIEFNGNQLTHGNKVNNTRRARVSMDFRILPEIHYHQNEAKESITLKTKFQVGEYYKRFN